MMSRIPVWGLVGTGTPTGRCKKCEVRLKTSPEMNCPSMGLFQSLSSFTLVCSLVPYMNWLQGPAYLLEVEHVELLALGAPWS